MSSLFSTPKAPEVAAAVVEPPPAPVLVTTPAPLPTPTIAPLPDVTTDPALAAQIDPTTVAADALARRSRGIQGTIATSLAGVTADGSSGADFSSNALLPQRKTLLGE